MVVYGMYVRVLIEAYLDGKLLGFFPSGTNQRVIIPISGKETHCGLSQMCECTLIFFV